MSDFAQIAADVAKLREAVQDHTKSESEKRLEFEKRMADVIENKKAADKVQNHKDLPQDAPLPDDKEERTFTQKGSIFGGAMRLPFEKAVSMSLKNPVVTATGAAQQLGELQNLHDACVIKFLGLKMKHDETTAWRVLARDIDFKAYNAAMARAGYVKAGEILNPGDATGSSLNFTLLSGQLLDLVRLELVLARQFRQVTLTRPQQAFPTLATDSMGVLGGGATAPPAQDTITTVIPGAKYFSNPTFSQVSFAVQHCLGYIQFNDDMTEDSVVPWLPIMREQVARSIARAIDRSILDGDAVTTHQDADVAALIAGGTPDFRASWNGLRHMTLTSGRISSGHAVHANNANLTPTFMQTMRQQLGKYGMNPMQLFYVLGVASYYDILANADLRLWASHGDMETQRTGVIDKYAGMDIVVSEFVRADLNATGVEDATTTDRSYALIANRDRFMVGTYGQVAVETTRHAPMLYNIIQADVRVDFKPIEGLTSGAFTAIDSPAAICYNVDVN